MSVKVKVFLKESATLIKYIFEILKCGSDNIMIEIELLEKYDAVLKQYKKSETIFEKDHLATGIIKLFRGLKMNNFNDEGRVYSRLLCESPFW
jgi:hypothetical protein